MTVKFIVLSILLQVVLGEFKYNVGKVDLHNEANSGLFLKSTTKNNFSAKLGVGLSNEVIEKIQPVVTNNGLKLQVGAQTTLELQRAGECTSVIWNSQDLDEIRDCIDYGQANWYAGYEQRNQLWPVEKIVHTDYAMITKELDNMGVAERYWLNSRGIYLHVKSYVPLFIDANAAGDNQLCFIAKFTEPYKRVTELRLHYDICTLPTAVEGHIHAANNFLNARPSALPDERVIMHPIWSTWVRYKRDINEAIIRAFAQEILDNNYANAQLEIDDDWETCYGELAFDSTKFPDPKGLVSNLKLLGFRVTLWIHPFVNEDCPSFQLFKDAGYLASDGNGNTQTVWWNGLRAGIVDFTNPLAKAWFLDRLRELQTSSGVDSFKFDAGETSWLPSPRILSGDLSLQPNIYSYDYVTALTEFAPLAEVRVGMSTQDLPLLVRMVDKDSRWGWQNGLKTVITTLLAMNMAGYSYVLPDMIGGNQYGIDLLTSELFIRWLQASTFMPILQFSYTPWDFNDVEVQLICRKFVDLHIEYTPAIMNYANESMYNGMPLNRPIWMLHEDWDVIPEDDIAFAIDDEYMLGDLMLVAPVTDLGAVTRDVYLPTGNWLDMNTGETIVGPIMLTNYPAPLDVLPYFQLLPTMER